MSDKKLCWLAQEYKKGWRLALCDNKKNYWIPRWFKSHKDIQRAIKSGIVFIHKAGSKYE